MKVTLRVAGKVYEIPLPDESRDWGHNKTPPITHPLYYLVKFHAMSEEYLTIIYNMATKLPKGQDVTDLMGGIGVFARVMWDMLEAKSWTLVDLDPECEQWVCEPRCKFVRADAYSYPHLTDVIFLDQATSTLRKIAENQDGRMALYQRVKEVRPKHMIITDFGYYWVHLPNHHPWYINTFGLKIPEGYKPGFYIREHYHEMWDQYFQENFGYRIANFETGAGSQYFHMVPI